MMEMGILVDTQARSQYVKPTNTTNNITYDVTFVGMASNETSLHYVL